MWLAEIKVRLFCRPVTVWKWIVSGFSKHRRSNPKPRVHAHLCLVTYAQVPTSAWSQRRRGAACEPAETSNPGKAWKYMGSSSRRFEGARLCLCSDGKEHGAYGSEEWCLSIYPYLHTLSTSPMHLRCDLALWAMRCDRAQSDKIQCNIHGFIHWFNSTTFFTSITNNIRLSRLIRYYVDLHFLGNKTQMSS